MGAFPTQRSLGSYLQIRGAGRRITREFTGTRARRAKSLQIYKDFSRGALIPVNSRASGARRLGSANKIRGTSGKPRDGRSRILRGGAAEAKGRRRVAAASERCKQGPESMKGRKCYAADGLQNWGKTHHMNIIREETSAGIARKGLAPSSFGFLGVWGRPPGPRLCQNVAQKRSFRTPKYRPNPTNGGTIRGKKHVR